jgi:mycothiol synthase
MSTRIEPIDTRSAPEKTLTALHELYLDRDRELEPAGDPAVPLEERLIDWRNLLDTEVIPRFAIWEGDRIVATAGAHMDLDQNLENAFGWVYVRPADRGRDLGRVIAGPMLDAVETQKRIRFATEINQGRPEEELAQRAGMRPAYTEKRSRLSFRDLDWSLMDLWVERAEERAGDYEVILMPTPMPEAHLQAFCDLWQVMNTAPSEDFEEEDEVLTPEMVRDMELKEDAKARDVLVYVARHKPTGALAGFTRVTCHRLQPDLVWQGDTGVSPPHRGKGLGRWLKAAMAIELRESHPEVGRIDTYNAGSNAPMLSINIEMGFKPVMVETVWQGELATLREKLAV